MIAKGDREAYKQFFERHYSGLVYFAHTILPNLPDAEDVVQEAFIGLWNERERLQAEGNLRSYLYTVVRNRCLDRLRREKRALAREEEMRYLAHPEDDAHNASALYEELLQLIAEEMDRLPEKYSTVLKMIYMEGLGYAEISVRLGVPEATLRKQKERALQLLNHALINRNNLLSAGVIAFHLPFLAELVTK